MDTQIHHTATPEADCLWAREAFVTMGQSHTHSVDGQTINKDCVVTFEANSEEEARAKAFELFGSKWCFLYYGAQWDPADMHYFPRGYVHIA